MAVLIPLFSSRLPSRNPPPRIRARTRHRVAAATRNLPKSTAVEPSRGGTAVSRDEKKAPPAETGELGVLYDDGYGSVSVQDYFAAARQIIRCDGGPPRWFCPVECGRPVKDSPLLLFLPGTDGVGMGLILHHKSLGKVFEVRCLHIPIDDRTPFEGLVKFVEHYVKYEHAMSPDKPIYLVGDSFGGCLALAVAARNPTIDLLLVLVNPATSFDRSQLQPLLPVLEALPRDLHFTVPYLLSFIMGDPVKMAMTSVTDGLPIQQTLDELSKSLTSLLPRLSDLAEIIPRETLLWKLMLLKSAASYVNSRLHAVEADVLVLASGMDNLLPSGYEADRLRTSLKNCKVRNFNYSGHTLLLEDGINLLSLIKGTRMYRRSRQHDFVTDYLPPTITDFKRTFEQDDRWFHHGTSPIIFSTLGNGRIVRGLSGVPDDGPVLLVGYHMLLGLELRPLYKEFLRAKKVIIRGMAHPVLFQNLYETSRNEIFNFDVLSLFGGLPVSATNLYKLFSRKSFVLLYPGGAREALHRKGEEYKLFWPDQPEFVRMAARFGATIVPFGAVGEDDLVELILDYNDLKSTPLGEKYIEGFNQDVKRLRTDVDGEVSNQDLFIPAILPKVPGRLYYLFGKPIETQGMKDILKDRRSANELYLRIKSEVEGIVSYLKRKREEDPYRGIVQRTIYQSSWGASRPAPTFEP